MTVVVCPGAAEFGLMDEIVAGGLRVTDELLELVKVVPVVVVPLIDAR